MAARDRPRLYRHSAGGGEAAGRGGARPLSAWPRKVPRARVGVGPGLRQPHQRAAQAPGRLLRLVPRALHLGRWSREGRPHHLRQPLSKRADLSRRAADQLVHPVPHGAVGPRSGARSGPRKSLAPPLSPGGRQRRRDRGHHAPRDLSGRHRRRRSSRRRSIHRPRGQEGRAAVSRPDDSHRRGRGRRYGLRHRLGQGHAGPRPDRLRDRHSSRPGLRQHHEPRRHDQRERRAVPGDGPRGGSQGDRRAVRERGPSGGGRSPRPLGRPLPAMQDRGGAAGQQAVVRQGGRSRRPGIHRRARLPGRGRRPDRHRPAAVREGVYELAGEHPRLVHQPPALVWAPYSRLVLRRRRRAPDGGRRRSPGLRAVRLDGNRAGPRRSGHLVQLGALAPLDPGLARRHRRPALLLPYVGYGDGIRHPVFLGGADDHDGDGEHRRHPVPHRLPSRNDPRRLGREDEQGEGERRQSPGDHRSVRHRRPALRPHHRHLAGERLAPLDDQAGVEPELRQQDLERRAVRAHGRGPGRRRRRGAALGAGAAL